MSAHKPRTLPAHSIELPRTTHGRAKSIAYSRGQTLEQYLNSHIETYADLPVTRRQSAPRDVVRVKLGVTDQVWDLSRERAAERSTSLTEAIVAAVEADTSQQ